MNLDRVGSGNNIPDEINVIIEIPAHSDPVKYEVDKETGAMFVDRFMSSAMFYPCNYGYVPHTLSKDGDPIDVLVTTPVPLIAGSVIQCRPVGVLQMTDESGDEGKWVRVEGWGDIDDAKKEIMDSVAMYKDAPVKPNF